MKSILDSMHLQVIQSLSCSDFFRILDDDMLDCKEGKEGRKDEQ